MQITIRQEIEFDKPTTGRCWRAEIEWEIHVDSGLIETPVGRDNIHDYSAEVSCGPTVEEFTLIDSEGCEFAERRNGDCLPDYVPYIKSAIIADIGRMDVDWEERACHEAINKYRESVGDAAADGRKVVAR